MKRFLAGLLLVGISLFFLFAGGSKLFDVAGFTRSVEQYRILSGQWAWSAALFFPWLECVLAVAVLVPSWRKAALCQLGLLLLVFQGILISALIRGLDISCGCLGGGMDGGVVFALVRNGVLLLLLVFLWLTCPKANETPRGFFS